MIPRHQRILFWTLLLGSVLMAVFLIRLRERAQDRLLSVTDPTPLAAPDAQPDVPVTFMLANDADGSIAPTAARLALPEPPGARARALLTALLAEYATAGSNHPINSGPAVEDVFLLPVPTPATVANAKHTAANSSRSDDSSASAISAATAAGATPAEPALIAVVNLTAAFAANHPSGIEAETLTLLSIAGTLHANLPQITQVRFLVDGQPRETLAGHADLTRAYLTASDSATQAPTMPPAN